MKTYCWFRTTLKVTIWTLRVLIIVALWTSCALALVGVWISMPPEDQALAELGLVALGAMLLFTWLTDFIFIQALIISVSTIYLLFRW